MTTPELQALLRIEVGRFREAERRRRRFELVLHVGVLAGARESATIPPSAVEHLDRQTRLEIASALVESAAEPTSVWLTRPGLPEPGPDDLPWAVAAAQAFGVAGLPLPGCWVVTRHGWVDLRSLDRRVWKRLRLDRGASSR